MELRHLRTFVAVAEEGSFTRASERLHIVQSAVSAGVRTLERELGAPIEAPSRPRYRVTVSGRRRALTAIVLDEAYRVAREAIRNAYEHARARHIETELIFGDAHLTIRVRDDGSGMDPRILARGQRPRHWGLPGMRERSESLGGRFKIRSSEEGTEVELRIPAGVAYRVAMKSAVASSG